MSKKKSTDDESFEEAIASAEDVAVPAPAQTAPVAAPATPLASFFAALKAREANQTELAKLAAANPEWVAHVDAQGFNALCLATLGQKRELARVLVELGSDVNLASTAMGWRPLVVAAGVGPGEDSLARLMLDKGADASSKTHDGLYALTSACSYGNAELAKTLMDRGAQPAPADAGWLPIIAAAGSGNVALVDLLVERGANPDQPLSPKNGFRSLHQAAKTGHGDMVARLVALNVDINAMSNEGETALHYACQRGDGAIVEILVKAGAKSNLENAAGKTALDVANPAIAKLLGSPDGERVKHASNIKAPKEPKQPKEPKAKVAKATKATKPTEEPAPKKAAAKKGAAAPAAKKPAAKTAKAMQALAQTAAKKIPAAKKAAKAAPSKPAAKSVAASVKKAAKPAPAAKSAKKPKA